MKGSVVSDEGQTYYYYIILSLYKWFVALDKTEYTVNIDMYKAYAYHSYVQKYLPCGNIEVKGKKNIIEDKYKFGIRIFVRTVIIIYTRRLILCIECIKAITVTIFID